MAAYLRLQKKSHFASGLGNRSFWKRANPSFFAKKSEKKSETAIHSFCALSLFLKRAKEQFALLCSFEKSNLLFGARFKRVKERFALWHSYGKEGKSYSLFVALFKRATEKNRSFTLFKD